MKHINNLNDLLVEQLREQLDAERQQLQALPSLRENTSTSKLQQIIDFHIGKTRKQMTRLEEVFSILGRNLRGEQNMAVTGLIKEAQELVDRCVTPEVKDAGIITSVQHFNHHNIASYGSLYAYAEELGMSEVSELLTVSLQEEQQIDFRLSELAKQNINPGAIDKKRAL